jgi:hypothetical protein
MKELFNLPMLHTLMLNKCAVSGIGPKELARLRNLKSLHLNQLDITEQGVNELNRALPNCTIKYQK